jgi:hypothetical protein
MEPQRLSLLPDLDPLTINAVHERQQEIEDHRTNNDYPEAHLVAQDKPCNKQAEREWNEIRSGVIHDGDPPFFLTGYSWPHRCVFQGLPPVARFRCFGLPEPAHDEDTDRPNGLENQPCEDKQVPDKPLDFLDPDMDSVFEPLQFGLVPTVVWSPSPSARHELTSNACHCDTDLVIKARATVQPRQRRFQGRIPGI